jgi:oxygen-independent coproporphyrinogen-3 oxidase
LAAEELRGALTPSLQGSSAASGEVPPPRSLYIHIPLCASKCSYCDFYSLPCPSLPEGIEEKLVLSTLSRASSLAKRFGASGFDTVYVGGGTPTMLSPQALKSLLSGILKLAIEGGGRPPSEWTVEANPDSLDSEALEAMALSGVTRISLGVQSLDPGELKILGRRHGPEEALAAVSLAASRGFAVSADLIAGIPRERGSRERGTRGRGSLARYAKELLDAGAAHLSAYDLCIEEGTPLFRSKASLDFPGEDEAWEERKALEAFLSTRGMRRYEVSNYAARGEECRHNLAYWRMDSYIGAGAGAVSTLALPGGASVRIEEPKDALGYASSSGPRAVETPIGLRDSAFETIMMAFRTSFGLDLAAFERRYGLDAAKLIGESLEAWKSRIVPGEAWPGTEASAGPALDGSGLDLLNRFLLDCLEEIEGRLY